MKADKSISVFLAELLAFLWIILYVFNEKGVRDFVFMKITNSSNIFMLAVAIGIFCVTLIFSTEIFRRTNLNFKWMDHPFNAFLVGGAVLYVLLQTFYNEVHIFGGDNVATFIWHLDNKIAWTGFFFAGAVAAVLIMLYEYKKKDKLRFVVYAFQGFVAVFYAWSVYLPNWVSNDGYSLYHGNAYFNSVYNVMHFAPYDDITNSVYGCYALILAPMTKLFGSTVKATAFVLSVLAFISFLALSYVLNQLVKTPLLRCLGSVVMTFPVTALRENVYFQAHPHRDIFVAVLLAYVVWGLKNEYVRSKKYILAGNVIIVAAIIWNIETGAVCAITWCGIYFLAYLRHWRELPCLGEFLKNVAYVFVDIICAYGIVCIYNYMVSGKPLLVRNFIFPYTRSLNDMIQTELPTHYCAWIIMFVVYLYYLGKAFVSDNRLAEETVIKYAVSLSGIGTMVYYINRTAYYNLDLSYFYIMILLVSFVDEYLIAGDRKFNTLKMLAWIRLTVIVILCFGLGVRYTDAEGKRNSTYRKMEELNLFAEQVKHQIPQDTRAFGMGIAELYSILNWDTKMYVLDFPDIVLSAESYAYIEQELLENDEEGFFTLQAHWEDIAGRYPHLEEVYQVEAMLVCGECSYYYCVPKGKQLCFLLESWASYFEKNIEDSQYKELADGLKKGNVSSYEIVFEWFLSFAEVNNLSDGEYIHLLYQEILRREESSEENEGWTSFLNSEGDRKSVFFSFLNAEEFRNKYIDTE